MTAAVVLAQLTPEQTVEAWKAYANFGIVGILAFVLFMFLVGCLGLFFWFVKRTVTAYLPVLISKAVEALDSVRKSQEGILQTQQVLASQGRKMNELHEVANERSEAIISLLQVKLDPAGRYYTAHPFSAMRVEGFLLCSLDLLEDYLKSEPDLQMKADWSKHLAAMRESLKHREVPPLAEIKTTVGLRAAKNS